VSDQNEALPDLNAKQRDAVLAAAIRWLIPVDHIVALALAEAELREAVCLLTSGGFQQYKLRLAAPETSAAELRQAADATFINGEYDGPGVLLYAFDDSLPEGNRVFPDIEVETAALPSLPERAAARFRNQGVLYPGPGSHENNGLRFRSKTEVRVAEALDDAGVMWFPLPVAVRGRVAKEPDFLVLTLGRVGILEVDGPTHTPLTRAQEDARAAWFQQSGVRLVHHVSVRDIDADAPAVVQRFLALLKGPVL
jgi:hypothetical protein